jgi:hypothetical protein
LCYNGVNHFYEAKKATEMGKPTIMTDELDTMPLDDDTSEKTLTSANTGFSVPEDVQSDVNANDSLYKTGQGVVIKAMGVRGIVTGVTRTKGGSYLYSVLSENGAYLTHGSDIIPDATGGIKAFIGEKPVRKNFDLLQKQILMASTLMRQGRSAYQVKGILQEILQTLARLNNLIPSRAISSRQLDSLSRQYARSIEHAQRNWRRGRDTEMQSDIDRLIAKTLNGVLQRAKRIERLFISKEMNQFAGKSKGDTVNPIYTQTRQQVLHGIVQAIQALIREGQPVAVAGRVISDPDDVRLVGAVAQVVTENDDGFDPITPDELDRLAEQLDVTSPTDHEILVAYAFKNGLEVPSDVLAGYPKLQDTATKAGLLSIRRSIGVLQKLMNQELPTNTASLRKLINDLNRVRHLNEDAKSTLMIAQDQLETVSNGGGDVTLQDVHNTLRLVLAKQQATKIPNDDADDEDIPSAMKALDEIPITVDEAIAQMSLSHKREKASSLLKSPHRFPDELRKCVRKLNNARRSGLMSGRTESALLDLNARAIVTLVVKLRNQGIAQADVTDWVTSQLENKYQAKGGTPIKNVTLDAFDDAGNEGTSDDDTGQDAPTGDIVADWGAYAEALTSAIKSVETPRDEHLTNVLDAIRMEAMDAYDVDKDAILSHVVKVEEALYEQDELSQWRERALQSAQAFENAMRGNEGAIA